MTVEQLMQPRYKVIAGYPDNKDFPIGKIIEFHPWESHAAYWEHTVEDCQGKRSWLDVYFDEYPHLFQKLGWWEERDEKDMPKYVKSKSEINPKVQRLARFDLESDSKWRMFLHHSIAAYNPYDYLPATEQEYNDYINQFKEK